MSGESQIRTKAGGQFSLIETFRFEPGRGFIRLDLHMERIESSASQFAFAFDKAATLEELTKYSSLKINQRIRIEVWKDGKFEIASSNFEPNPEGTIWKLAIAKTRLDSSNAFLQHKTSLRRVYNQARAEFPMESASEVLLMNEREELCEGTISNLFLDLGGGVLATPPIKCGLLPGILRKELLSQRRAVEKVLTSNEINSAKRIFVGNSLRGLIKAELID